MQQRSFDSRHGRQLYVNPEGQAGVAFEGDHSNTDLCRRAWTHWNGLLTLGDGRQLYVDPSWWACVAFEGEHNSTDPNSRTCVLSKGLLTFGDGRQLYVNPAGWAGVAFEGEYTNMDFGGAVQRRTWTRAHGRRRSAKSCLRSSCARTHASAQTRSL